MSLFGPRKKIYVSSVIYNLAGNYDERTNYIKHLVLNSTIYGSSVADTIIGGTLKGPRMDFQTYFRWAKTNYPMGMPEGGIFKNTKIEAEEIIPYLPPLAGWEPRVDNAYIQFADYQLWAEEWVMDNYPERSQSLWEAEINDNTNEITILWEDETLSHFVPTGFSPKGRYIIGRYFYAKDPDPLAPRELVTDGPVNGPFPFESSVPDLEEYDLVDESDVLGITRDLNEITDVVVTYSDARPGSSTSSSTLLSTMSFDRLVQTFERRGATTVDPVDNTHLYALMYVMKVWQDPKFYSTSVVTTDIVEIEPGVYETTVTTVITEAEHPTSGMDWYWEEDEFNADGGYRIGPKQFRYLLGSGNAFLDNLDASATVLDGYFPMIPLRRYNEFITEPPMDVDVLPYAKKAWQKATSGGKISKLIDTVSENEDLADIDHAFVVYGVCLNTLSREGKEYIYRFMDKLITEQTTQPVDYDAFVGYEEQRVIYANENQRFLAYGGPPPTPLPDDARGSMPTKTELRVHCTDPNTEHYDFRFSWRTIRKETFAGEMASGARINSVIIRKGTKVTMTDSYRAGILNYIVRVDISDEVIEILRQDSENSYTKLTVYGAEHQNVVYDSKAVIINSTEALDDPEDSGFIIPLQYSTLRSMPLLRANQLCLEASLIVFNCYVIKKKKWYQTLLGAIIIGLITMGIGAVFSGGASILGGGGILGSNALVGATLGVSGTQAAIVGAVVNSVAGTIIGAVLSEGLTKIFGAKFGAIFGALIGIAMTGFSSGMMGGNFNLSFNTFMQPQNLLKLTNATATAYSIHIAEKTQKLYEEMEQLGEEYGRAEREIEGKYIETFGYSASLDPMAFTDILNTHSESSQSFIKRTLMVGTDIIELANLMISDYAEMNLDIDLLKGDNNGL